MTRSEYKERLAKERKNIYQIMRLCPEMQDRSGIYMFYRMDENGKVIARYIGKSETSILKRCASHLQGTRQHIDLSIRNHGLYSEDNPTGWDVTVLEYCEPSLCNERERKHIAYCQKLFVGLHNVEGGGSSGKTDINERKPLKGYRKGVNYGRYKLSKELQTTLRYLNIAPKDENKRTIRMYNKFLDLITPKEKEGDEDGEK